MHMETCERDGRITKETTERIEAKVDRNAEKRQAQHEESQRQMDRMEKRLLYGLVGIAGLIVWEYFVKRLYLG